MTTYLTKIPKKGPSFDFYDRLTVTWTTFGNDGYNGDGYMPNEVIPFSTQGIIIVNEDNSSVIEVSFNGKDVHARLDPAISRGFVWDNRVNSLVWFRLASGSSAVVNIQAWGIR